MLDDRWRASLAALLLLWATHQLAVFAPAGLTILLLLPVLWATAALGVWYRSRGYAWLAVLLLGAALLFPGDYHDAPILLVWLVVITAATERRPDERAVLLRVCVTVVYAFVAVSKLNPSWLSGDQLRNLIATRPQVEVFGELLSSPVARGLAVATIVVEAWLALGLWFTRTRVPTAALGVLLHTTLVVVAHRGGWPGLVILVVLNFGLVAAYPAFWADLPARRSNSSKRERDPAR